MSGAKHTMSPEEEAAFVANPASFALRGRGFEPTPPRVFYGVCGHVVSNNYTKVCRPCYDLKRREPQYWFDCSIPGCTERVATTKFCPRHQAVWDRLHA